MKKTKLLAGLLLFGFMFSYMALYAGPVTATPEQTVKNVAIVFSTGGLGDKSFNDAGFLGAQRANDTSKVNIDYVEPTTVDEINNYVEQFASDTETSYDLIIAIGFSSSDGVNASSLAHTDKNFAIIDSVVSNPNVANIVFQEHEGSFLVGAMAAMTSTTGKLGFLGGLDIPLINKFRSGFEQGARYINPDVELFAQYSPDANNPWGDVAGGKTVANQFISQGADVIYAAAGGTGLGVFDAAKDAEADGKTVYGIGVDSDQDYLEPGYVLASMVKRVDVAVENLIKSVIDGTFDTEYKNTVAALGLEQNGVGISEMTYTGFIKDSACNADKTRYEVVQDIKASIVAGDIVVAEEVKTSGFNTEAHKCTEAVPDRATATLSSDTSSGAITSPGFELLAIFAIAAIPLIRKLRK